jgi:hypothetical protein
MIFLGLPSAFAMDRVTNDRVTNDRVANDRAAGGLPGARPCATRFDYVLLASFADASLLSLAPYYFRSEVRFGTIPLTGLLRVDYNVAADAGEPGALEPAAGDCRSRGSPRQNG